MKKGMFALAMGGLSIGMAEFTMMGILPDIAVDIQKDIPTAAHLIALYALGVSVGAPTLVLATAKMNSKRVAIILMLLFFLFHGAFSLMPNYTSMKWMRFLAGLPHGAFFGVGSVVAAKMAPKGKEAQYISIMFAGLTLANLVGVPIGTFIGHTYSWRLAYGMIAVLGLFTASFIFLWLPRFEADKEARVMEQLSYFKSSEAWYLIAIVSIGTGGLFAWMSYIAPMVINVSHVPIGKVPFIMTLVGLGMFIGNLVGGKLADTVSPTRALMVCLGAVVVCMVGYSFISHITWAAYPMSFITGLITFTIGAPIQILLIRTANGADTLAASVGQASFNIGNTLGAFLGGIPITLGYAYDKPVLVGAGLAFLGLIITFIFFRQIVVKKYGQGRHRN